MFALLNWRLWLLAGIAIALAGSHFAAYRKGRSDVQSQWIAATAQANREVRAIEQHRETVLGVALKSSAARAVVNRVDASRASGAVLGLRDAITARRLAEESASAATKRADTLGDLLVEGVSAYRELAETCDRHVTDLRLLIEAWPR